VEHLKADYIAAVVGVATSMQSILEILKYF
jgi:hypothetical protein